jgi:hypothetical protein
MAQVIAGTSGFSRPESPRLDLLYPAEFNPDRRVICLQLAFFVDPEKRVIWRPVEANTRIKEEAPPCLRASKVRFTILIQLRGYAMLATKADVQIS